MSAFVRLSRWRQVRHGETIRERGEGCDGMMECNPASLSLSSPIVPETMFPFCANEDETFRVCVIPGADRRV